MKSFTSTSVIACTLAISIAFGGGAAHADTLPDAPSAVVSTSSVTPTASPTPRPTATASPAPKPTATPKPTGTPSPSAKPSVAHLAAVAKHSDAATLIAAKNRKVSAATIAALTNSDTALKAALVGSTTDATFIKLIGSVDASIAAVKKSDSVYSTARAALTAQTKVSPADLPKGILDAQKTTAAALTSKLTALSSDNAVATATNPVTAWTTNAIGYRPAKTTATGYATQLTSLRASNSYPAATTATASEASNTLTALTAALNAAVPQTVTLTAVSDRAKSAIIAWKQSDIDRAATYKTAVAINTSGAAAHMNYAPAVNVTAANTLKAALTALSAGLNTATPAQLTTLTSAVKTTANDVTNAYTALTSSQSLYDNGMKAMNTYPRVPTATKAATVRALGRLKDAITAKLPPAGLTAYNADVNAAVAAQKAAHAAAPLREQLEWVSANAWSKSYTWGHQYIFDADCANFASHSLYIRGLGEQVLNISSTSLRNYLVSKGYKETADTQAARKTVKPGDVIQFDWDPTPNLPSDRDHTGIVTGIGAAADGTVTIQYTAHSGPGDVPSVNRILAASFAGSGRVHFISI